MEFERSAGILLPIFSLPSKYGIGTMGGEAYKFIDFLEKAGQKYWQILPIGPTGYGDSPYQSFSTFAGNPYFIDLDFLVESGDISLEDVQAVSWYEREDSVDYGMIYNGRNYILEKVYHNSYAKYEREIEDFKRENEYWIDNYSLYMALKKHFGMKSYIDWEDRGARLRDEESLNRYRELLKEDINYYTFIQFIFYRQWEKLKAYANSKNIEIIGDIPIYVSLDSSDCWANPKLFLLDEENVPTFIAGVPPDYFSEDGQLWGNPLYNWAEMKNQDYAWWKERIKGAKKLYDVIRIDHFRGFESFYKVKYGSTNARIGEWEKGGDIDFIQSIKREFPDTKFIAENLGLQSDEVRALLAASEYPGMKIVCFAFDADDKNEFLPHRYEKNCVCYAGTHDNDTILSWSQKVNPREVEFAKAYGGISEAEGMCYGILRLGLSSVANVFVAQLQDYMELGEEGRINMPGKASGNWSWRLKNIPEDALAYRIRGICNMYSR